MSTHNIGYREADLHLCFRICRKPVFSRCGSNDGYFLYEPLLIFEQQSEETNILTYAPSKNVYQTGKPENLI